MREKLILSAFSIGALFSELISDLFNNRFQFIAIVAVVALDAFFGIVRALKENEFETRKSLKSLYMLVAYWFLLAVVLLIEKGFPFASFLSEAVLLPILVSELVSILKNMSLVGLITNGQLANILENIDRHKNVNLKDNA